MSLRTIYSGQLFPRILPALVFPLLILAANPVQAQQPQLPAGSLPTPWAGTKGFSFLTRPLEWDMPGLTDACNPFLYTPVLRGEMRVRPVFIGFSGQFEDTVSGQSFDLVDQLGYVNQGTLVETMVRGQLARFSARLHYDAYLRTFRGAGTRLDWPEFRVGADLDLVYSEPLRAGLDMDFYPARPLFSYSGGPLGTGSIESPRPATWGVHLVYNPADGTTMSPSVEARGRFSLRTGTRIREWEIAAGFKAPWTVLGTFGLRGGYRDTRIEMHAQDLMVNVHWQGVFGEIVTFY